MDVISIIEEEQNRRKMGGAIGEFVIFRDDGDAALVRFLDELKSDDEKKVARVISVHEVRGPSRDDFRSMLCTGDGCQYCSEGNRPIRRVLLRAFVYWFESGGKREKVHAVKVIDLKASSMAMAELVNDYRARNTITDSDYLVVRTGTGFDTKYSARRQDASPFKYPKTAQKTWITLKRLRELVEARYGEQQGEGEEG